MCLMIFYFIMKNKSVKILFFNCANIKEKYIETVSYIMVI